MQQRLRCSPGQPTPGQATPRQAVPSICQHAVPGPSPHEHIIVCVGADHPLAALCVGEGGLAPLAEPAHRPHLPLLLRRRLFPAGAGAAGAGGRLRRAVHVRVGHPVGVGFLPLLRALRLVPPPVCCLALTGAVCGGTGEAGHPTARQWSADRGTTPVRCRGQWVRGCADLHARMHGVARRHGAPACTYMRRPCSVRSTSPW